MELQYVAVKILEDIEIRVLDDHSQSLNHITEQKMFRKILNHPCLDSNSK